jgi:hypothetical protein
MANDVDSFGYEEIGEQRIFNTHFNIVQTLYVDARWLLVQTDDVQIWLEVKFGGGPNSPVAGNPGHQNDFLAVHRRLQ